MNGDVADLNGRHLETLRRAYMMFWQSVSNKPEVNVDPASEDYFNFQLDNGRVVIGTTPGRVLRFEDLRYRRDRPTDSMDVCLQFKKTVRGREINDELVFEIKESTTWASYLRILEGDGPVAELKHAFHFDFRADVQDDHPIFHVQYDPRSIEIDTLERNYDIQNASDFDADYPDIPRVPSAPLDIVGVIYQIIRDSLQTSGGWPSGVKSQLNDMAKFPLTCFNPEPQSGAEMFPEWWYIHGSSYPELEYGLLDSRSLTNR